MSNVSRQPSVPSRSRTIEGIGILFDLHYLNGKLIPFLDYNRRVLSHYRYTLLQLHREASWGLNAESSQCQLQS